jgi:hypothetical protein
VGVGQVTYHPGIYDRPEKAPYLDIGNLFKVLARPKEAFEDLYDHTTQTQGMLLAVIFIVIGALVGYAAMALLIDDLDIPTDAEGLFVPSDALSIASTGINIVLEVFTFFFASWLVFQFLKAPDKGKHPSLDKTIGLLGYAKFPAFIIGFIIAISTPLVLGTINFDELDEDNPDAIGNALGAMCGFFALLFGLGIVAFIWAIFVHSHGASVANDTPLGTAAGFTLVAWIIAGLVLVVLQFVVNLALGLSLTL